jgi:glutamate formiminotransferase
MLITAEARCISKTISKKMLVACNVYVSAGLPQYSNLLLQLLGEAQEHCRTTRLSPSPSIARWAVKDVILSEGNASVDDNVDNERVVIVHAFCDGPYDRSSFHIAGSPCLVASVASRLATRAVETLEEDWERALNKEYGNVKNDGANEIIVTPHPTVGLVDHVSVLPLAPYTFTDDAGGKRSAIENDPPTTGLVAQRIGESLVSAGVNVLYYGYADLVSQRPLATVRRESTTFFQPTISSTSSSENRNGGVSNPGKGRGQATVGAPNCFTENFNIRLRPHTPKAIAQSLTRHVRERDGGLPFVEALTLRYGQDQYEVACNLLDPSVTAATDIIERVQSWAPNHIADTPNDISNNAVEIAYRVGTTAEMCIDAIKATMTRDGEEEYNRQVMHRFKHFIHGTNE